VSQPSDRMLELLKQISVLRELDDRFRRGAKTDGATRDFRERGSKSRQIREEMKKLASVARRKLFTKD
jgi:hypothetical protein